MDDLGRILEEDKVIAETGDMLCFHKGYGQAFINMGASPIPASCTMRSPCLTAVTAGCWLSSRTTEFRF